MLHQTLDFLTNVFGEDEIEDGYFAIMTLPQGGKPNHMWFNDVMKAAAYASDCDHLNTYFSMGLFPKHAGRRMENVMGMACFGIDVDIKGAAHQRTNLCDDREAAIELLNTAIPGCLPTTIISSGHGIQGFYIFKEPIMFEDMDDRRAAYATASALHRTVAMAAGKHGWHIDSTFDLSRVMRLPGTYNVKIEGDPRLVCVMENSGQKYAGLEDFDGSVVADQEDWERVHTAFRASMPVWTNRLNIMLQQDACAPEWKLEEILEAESRFAAIWFRKAKPGRRKEDPREEDHSLSVIDMALTNKMVEYGWTNQEIANTIIEYRRKWQKKPGDFAKALRMDYIERTILKAREKYTETKENKELAKITKAVADKVTKAQAEGRNPAADDGLKEHAREVMKKAFGVEVARIIKYPGDNPEYIFDMPLFGEVKIGTSSVLMNQQRLRQALFDHASVTIAPMKTREFQNLHRSMLALTETQIVGEESSDSLILRQRVKDFWSANIPSENKDEGFVRKSPFIDDKRAYIFGSPFRRWLTTEEGERVPAKIMGMQMAQIGCKAVKMNFMTLDSRGRKTWNTSVYDITSVVGLTEVEDGEEK